MLGAMELLVIAIAFLLLFGPDKIPRIARDFGRAWGELRKFQDELTSGVNATGLKGLDLGLDGLMSPSAGPTRTPLSSGSSFKLKQVARKLGIDVEGKSDAQLVDAINVQMGKLASREDGRAIFKELQEQTREERERKVQEKLDHLKGEPAGAPAAQGGDGQGPAPRNEQPAGGNGTQAGEAEPPKTEAATGGN